MKQHVKRVLIFIYHIFARILPLDGKKAIFMSNMGRNYSGNSRAIYEAMEKDARFSRIKKIWAFNGDFFASLKKGRGEIPKGCRIVRYGGLKYYFHMANAGMWIFDTRQEPYLVKRKGNIYLQTWHGTPLKKLGLDIVEMKMAGEDRSIDEYRKSVVEESAKWDYLLAQNDFSEKVLPKCFGYTEKVLKTGYPRNDVLAGAPANSAPKKKTLLYAPTWRDDEYLDGGFYKCPSRPDFRKLEKLLGRDYRIIVKLHYLVKLRKGDIPEECIRSGFIKVCGNERDISELYLKADGLITDYSSVFFDYSVLERPVFFFCYDLEQYRDELRGFYLDFEEIAPGPISRTEEELARDIVSAFGNSVKRIDEAGDDMDQNGWRRADYFGKLRKFKAEYNRYDDGHAAQRVLDILSGAN